MVIINTNAIGKFVTTVSHFGVKKVHALSTSGSRGGFPPCCT